MNFEQEFKIAFEDKYDFLQLKDVVVNKKSGLCTITFLYPSSVQNLTDDEKNEIINWLKQNLTFQKLSLKVKFMKVFLEERLIRRAIHNYFESKYKLVVTYLNDQEISININSIDVLVDIQLSARMNDFFVEHKIPMDLAKYLKENFLVEFVVSLYQNDNIVDDVDIDNVEIKAKFKPSTRYRVDVVKSVVGKDIVPKPEYISSITSPKKSVIIAGFIKKIEKRSFIRKKGKFAGKEKAYYSFQVADGKGRMNCVYFCPNKNVAVMDALEEYMYVLLQGDVRLNQMNKLSLVVERIALASQIEQKQEERNMPEGDVVKIEKLTTLEQDTMFEHTDKYNSKIMGKTIVVFDIETTGLNTETDQIIELGAVKIENGNIVEKFSTFVKPTIKLPFEIVRLTGITDEMLENAPPIDLVIKDFYKFTRGCVLSGHNLLDFDIKFIKREGENVGLTFDNETIDTLHEARRARLGISKFTLANVVKTLGLTLEGAHRAWNDAYATAQVLLKLNEVKK